MKHFECSNLIGTSRISFRKEIFRLQATLRRLIFIFCARNTISRLLRGGVIFRRYNGSKANRRGYGFPLSESPFDLNAAIELLKADSVLRGEALRFCLCNEEQRAEIDKIIAVDWKSFDGDSDYIYKRESLSQLLGRKLHSKKNRFNKFMRSYPDAQYLPLTTERLADALHVVEQWFAEHDDGNFSLKGELLSIREAVANWESLNMCGGLIYVDDEPVAMTMFSAVSEQCIDTHFEKSTNKFAQNGAYTAIIQCMASSKETSAYKYINREEDMGVDGLRLSKESYQPDFKLKKYHGEVVT